MIPRYSMIIQWSDEDDAFLVTLPEFGGCRTHGTTYEEAARNGREVLELLVESCLEDGEPLPDVAKKSISA
jgi:antitoxin HicB